MLQLEQLAGSRPLACLAPACMGYGYDFCSSFLVRLIGVVDWASSMGGIFSAASAGEVQIDRGSALHKRARHGPAGQIFQNETGHQNLTQRA